MHICFTTHVCLRTHKLPHICVSPHICVFPHICVAPHICVPPHTYVSPHTCMSPHTHVSPHTYVSRFVITTVTVSPSDGRGIRQVAYHSVRHLTRTPGSSCVLMASDGVCSGISIRAPQMASEDATLQVLFSSASRLIENVIRLITSEDAT